MVCSELQKLTGVKNTVSVLDKEQDTEDCIVAS